MTKIRKAVVLLAGYGSRFFPITKAVPKCMVNILNKPVIHYVINELVDCGFEQAILILPTYCRSKMVEDYFYNAEVEKKFPYNNTLIEIKEMISKIKLSFLYTSKANGTGGAVLEAISKVKKQPFAVLNGDDLFFDNNTVLSDMIDTYDKTGENILAVMKVDKSQIYKYGICEYSDEKGELYLNKLIEKPKIVETDSRLALVGRYIFNYNIFDYLRKTTSISNGEILLTDTISNMIKEGNKFILSEKNIKRLDLGSIDGFLEANILYAQKDLATKLKLHKIISESL